MQRVILASFFLSAIALSKSTIAEDAVVQHDYDLADTLIPGIGIEGEPSLKRNCDKTRESIRLLDYHTSLPKVLYRIERTEDEVTYTVRRYAKREETEAESRQIRLSDWDSIVAEVIPDSLWAPGPKQSHMSLHGPRLILEVCLLGQYRFLGLDPDVDPRLEKLSKKLVTLPVTLDGLSSP